MSELPKGWSKQQLGSLASTITKGTTPTTIGFQYQSEGIPFIKVENIENNRIYHSSVYQFISLEAHSSLSRSAFEAGDVLFSIAGTIGKTALVSESDLPCNTNQAVAIIRGATETLVADYLKYNLTYRAKEIFQDNARGGAMNNVSLGDLKKTLINIPPLAEQKRIVEKLDQVLAQVDTIKARLDGIPAILKRFRQSVLAAAVSGKLTEEWRGEKKPAHVSFNEIKLIKENLIKNKVAKKDLEAKEGRLLHSMPKEWLCVKLCSVALKITDGEHKTPKREGTGNYLLSARNVRDGYIALDNVDYVGDEEFSKLRKRCDPNKGDILISCSGSVGRVCLVDEDDKYVMVRSAALVRGIDEIIFNKFMMLALQSPILQKNIEDSSRSTAQSNLFLGPIKELDIPLPSLKEQTEIVRLVDQYFAFADTIEKQVQKAQQRVDKLTQSILAKAFRGELVPQDPRDEPADQLLKRIAAARAESEALAKAAKKVGKRK